MLLYQAMKFGPNEWNVSKGFASNKTIAYFFVLNEKIWALSSSKSQHFKSCVEKLTYFLEKAAVLSAKIVSGGHCLIEIEATNYY